jgi:DNA-binding MarR family transcriptional regulator
MIGSLALYQDPDHKYKDPDMSSRSMPNPMAKRLGYCIKRAQAALRASMDQAMRPLGLTTPQYAVLSAIELHPGISNAALARAAFVTAQTMQGIVTNLEKAGLLVRGPDPSHGRILKGQLTARGQRVLTKAHDLIANVERTMLDGVPSVEAEKMASLLIRCADNLLSKRTAGGYARSKVRNAL